MSAAKVSAARTAQTTQRRRAILLVRVTADEMKQPGKGPPYTRNSSSRRSTLGVVELVPE